MSWLKPSTLMVGIVVMVGCCDPSQDLTNPFHQTLLSNAVMQFVDSSGNELVLLYDGRDRIDVSGYADPMLSETACDPRAHMYSAKFIAGPDVRFGFKEYVQGALFFDGVGGAIVYPEDATNSIIIQGHTYSQCDVKYSDTTQAYPTFIFDLEYGIILMARQGEYRWERVLNP